MSQKFRQEKKFKLITKIFESIKMITKISSDKMFQYSQIVCIKSITKN